MGDGEKWQQVVSRLTREYSSLEPEVRRRCSELLTEMIRLKEEMNRFSAGVGGAVICRECGGACCVRGKYHLTLQDLLAMLEGGVTVPRPRFDRFPECPYLGAAGCQMAPAFRPYTCVIFNCELIEDRLSAADRHRFSSLECCLRTIYAEVEGLFGDRFMGGVLNTLDARGDGTLLRRSPPIR
jgi:hypothetical protein